MFASASHKNVQTISEGNFHSCYASNKAEKFKFRRLSQGLESCAQAQSLKFRKKEKELLHIYQHLEKEKEKHSKERKDQKFYLEHAADGGSSSDISSVPSASRKSPTTKVGESSHQHHHTGSDPNIKRESKSGHVAGELKGHDKSSAKKRRASAAKLEATMVPFYMRHSYTHYHKDPHYDEIVERSKKSDHDINSPQNEQPCWKKDTKLTRLKTRRQALTDISEEQLMFLRSLSTKQSVDHCELFQAVDSSDKSSMKIAEKTSSFDVERKQQMKQQSSKALPDLGTGSTENHLNSVLTPLERQELAKHHRNVRAVLTPPLLEQRTRPRRHTIHCVNNSKTSFLKSLLIRRLQNGESLHDIANDEAFDNVLEMFDDGRVYPSFERGVEPSFEDFCALRKCEYLRVSKLNLQSLKEATMASMLK